MTTWQITKGAPTAEETAALTAVLVAALSRAAAAGRDTATKPAETGTGWHRTHRGRHAPPGTWRGR
ncbi:acyl-CoA carboxylase epsilon subunit [Streptomyces sp. BPSDS2]|uniref:acyl-CoA carboxylase epsilon subunit n=1 Tax=Streptomyces sp. BPSDS2 TaxID=2571021 RepID=UPI0010C21A2F|nr:acyl-CoA carboxylase epsilon subunit [Streptomyces sp. BPSDS2]